MVTITIKRRQLGDRVIRQYSPEILLNYCADSLFILEGNTKLCVTVSMTLAVRGLKVSHVVQWYYINWGETIIFISVERP